MPHQIGHHLRFSFVREPYRSHLEAKANASRVPEPSSHRPLTRIPIEVDLEGSHIWRNSMTRLATMLTVAPHWLCAWMSLENNVEMDWCLGK